jgi:hypothetical protein
MQMDFTPLVYSVDGIVGREAKNVEKHLAYTLSKKWHKPHSQILVYYIWVLMAIAMVHANILLIRGTRDQQCFRRPVIFDRHAMNGPGQSSRSLLGPYLSSKLMPLLAQL